VRSRRIKAEKELLLGFARRPLRSRRGDARLKELQQRYSTLRHLRRRAESLPPLEFATAIGLFGLVALEGTPLQDLRKSLQPPSGGSGCGSSCGGGCGGGCGGD